MKRSPVSILRLLLVAASLAGSVAVGVSLVDARELGRPQGMPLHSYRAAGTLLRIWYGTDDPTEQALAQSLARRFEAGHRGVTVDLRTYNLDDLNGRMALALSAGNPPDLIYTTPRGPGLAAYVRAGQLTNLSPVWRQDGWTARLRPGLLLDYNRLLAANSGTAGHVYAVPYVMAAVGVLYNKAIFARLHLVVPRTLAELVVRQASS